MIRSAFLVASANGLGHARRLFYLHNEFLRQGIKSEILVNSFQYDKCRSEIPKEELDTVLVSNSKFGLDGPHANFSDLEDKTSILKKIQNAENVLSDNTIWPASLNDNSFVHGHFMWIDYWRSLVDSGMVLPPTELCFEENLGKNVRAWFGSRVFGFSKSNLVDDVTHMPLIRYPNDKNFESYKRNWQEIWVSVGTTKDKDFLNFDSTLKFLVESGFKIHFRETKLMHDLKVLPGLVIGRPGLGTIRDCLASATAFLTPPNSNQQQLNDPELSNNLEVLSKAGLLPCVGSIDVWTLTQYSLIYQNFWLENSCPISEYSNRILQLISEKRK